jgi:hypothetical protein
MKISLSRDARHFTGRAGRVVLISYTSVDARDRLAVLPSQGLHRRRVDLRDVRDGAPIKFAALRPIHWLIFSQVRALRGLFQAHESSVLGARLDCLVVLRDTRDVLSGDLDVAGPAFEASGAAVSIYDVARSVGASAHLSDPTRGRGASPPSSCRPPETSD